MSTDNFARVLELHLLHPDSLGRLLEAYLLHLDANAAIDDEAGPVLDFVAACRELVAAAPPAEVTARVLGRIERACGVAPRVAAVPAKDGLEGRTGERASADSSPKRERVRRDRPGSPTRRAPEPVAALQRSAATSVESVQLPPEQLATAWAFMVSRLAKRGFSRTDVEDAAQNVLVRMMEQPDVFAARLANLGQNEGWFMATVLNEYLSMVRVELRRRREEPHVRAMATDARGSVPPPDWSEKLLTLADAASLTPLQRAYLEAVFIDYLFVDEIADRAGTSQRAVRTVLTRAAQRLRDHLLTQERDADQADLPSQ
jgi:DNA-directed RNA polymerase specialized sigma24 family protein